MANITDINLGTGPNSGDGIPLRNGGAIINSNFNILNDTKIEIYQNTGDPTANDDSANTSGNGTFTSGDYIWLNTTTEVAYAIVNDTATAAVWKQITVEGADLTKLSFISVSQAVDLDNMESITDAALVDGDFSTNGVMVRTAAGSYTNRSIVDAGSNKVTVTNGNGVAGDITLDVNEGNIDHDSLSGFVANEHIDHTSVSITGGGLLSGGGDISANRTITLANSDIDHDQLTNFVSNEHIDHSAVSINPGTRLTGGGDLTATRTLNVDVSDLEKDIRLIASTGVITGAEVSGTIGGTTFDVAPGEVRFYDTTTDPANPTETVLNYVGATNVTITDIATTPITYILMNSSGVLVQQSSGPTPAQRRTHATLAIAVHTTGVVSGFIEGRIPPQDQLANQIQDFALAVGPINLSGNVFSGNGNNLQIDKTAGTIYANGQNVGVSREDPSTVALASLTATPFTYTWKDGSGGWNTAAATELNPGFSDDGTGGASQPSNVVNGNNWSVQRVYVSANNTVVVHYGQEEYGTLNQAIERFTAEDFEVNPSLDGTLLRCFILLRGGASDLTDIADAEFLEASKFGGVGGGSASGGTLQGAYNISSEPEILTDSTRGALALRRGSAADSDLILEGQNGVGTTTFSVAGDGDVVATNYTGTLLTAAQPNITSTGNLAINQGATGTAFIEVGQGRAVDETSFIDLVGDTTFTDYGLRVARNSGASGGSLITSRGDGVLNIQTEGAGSLALNTNGTSGLIVDGSTQNVSIPNGSLSVNGAADSRDFNLKGIMNLEASANTNAWAVYTNSDNSYRMNYNGSGDDELVIDSSGNIGLGTSAPRSLAGFTSLGIDNTSGSFLDLFVNGTRQSTLSADATSVTLESATTLPFRVVTNGTAALTVDSSQDVTMSSNLDISGDVELGTDQVNTSSISKVFNSAHQAGNQGASIGVGLEDGGNISGMFVENVASTSSGFNSQEISFRTSHGNIVVSTERMRITQTGDVSVGIAAPETRLHISGGDANGWTSFTDNSNNNSRLKIGSRNANSSAIQSVRIDTDANTDLTLQPLGGNVGVGTTSPDSKFHVSNGSAGTFTPGSSFDDTVIENNGSTGVTVVSPDADVSAIGFSSPGTTNDVGALVRWQYGTGGSTQQMILGTNSTNGGISLRTGSFVEAMNINSTRAISTGGESAPDVSAGGLCLNQGSEDGNIFTFKSSDVSHAMTGNAEADTYGVFRKGVAESGMLVIEGFSEVGQAVAVSGRGTSEDTSDDTSSRGTVVFSAAISDGGTGITDVSNTGNAFAWVNNNTARMLLKGNGDLHVTNTSLTALDNENDLMLARNFQMATGGEGYKHTVSKEGMQQLKDLKILNEDGSMVNKQNESALLFGSISQIGNMLGFLADKLGISKEDLLTEAMNYDNTITY